MNDRLSKENATLLGELARFQSGKHSLLRKQGLTTLAAGACKGDASVHQDQVQVQRKEYRCNRGLSMSPMKCMHKGCVCMHVCVRMHFWQGMIWCWVEGVSNRQTRVSKA